MLCCRSQRGWAEQRELAPFSATEQLLQSLDTGDVLLFSRRVWDGRVSAAQPAASSPVCHPQHSFVRRARSALLCPACLSCQPLRSVYVLLSKYLNGEYDHCGVVVRDRSCDVSYLLEIGCTGRVQLLACDTRLLHSASREVVVRKLDAPRTAQQLDHVDRLVVQLAHAQQPPPPPLQPLAAFSHALTPSLLLPLERLLRLAAACVLLGAGGGQSTRSLHQLGQFIQTRQERARTERRVRELSAELASGALDANSATRLAGKQQRLLGELRRAERRESELRRQVEKNQSAATRQKANPAAASLSEVAAAACPSAALSALLLQQLEALPVDAWPPGSDCTVQPPSLSHFLAKHFLSVVSLPLAPDAVLERELFFKSAGKPLPYTVAH